MAASSPQDDKDIERTPSSLTLRPGQRPELSPTSSIATTPAPEEPSSPKSVPKLPHPQQQSGQQPPAQQPQAQQPPAQQISQSASKQNINASSSQTPQSSQSSLHGNQNVTVETETVPSVTTLSVNPNATLRIKRSQDSVPRLSTSKNNSKRRSLRLAQGSKADIFAAKVASAVEEHDSSDDEDFVYQAPITGHGSEQLRRPYMRTMSNSSMQPPSSVAVQQGPDDYPESRSVSRSGSRSESNEDDRERDLRRVEAFPAREAQHDDEVPPGAPNGGGSGGGGNANSHYGAAVPSSPRSFVVPKSQRSVSNHGGSINNNHTQLHPPEREITTDEESSGWLRSSQPAKLRGSDMISPTKDPNDSIRAKHLYLQRWRVPPAHSQTHYDDLTSDETQDERASLLRGRPSLYNYQSSRNSYGRRKKNNPLALGQQQQYQQYPEQLQFPHLNANAANQRGGNGNGQGFMMSSSGQPTPTSHRNQFMSDAEFSPTDSSITKFREDASLSTRIVIGASLLLILVLSGIFITGVMLAAARPLRDFDVVALSDVLVSDRELIFSMITHARNPGIFSRIIDHGELDVFATSSHTSVGQDSSIVAKKDPQKARTVLLGTIYDLESPINFRGGMSSPTQWRSASAKLVSPLGNNTQLWSEITAYEFDLTIKGVLMYSVLGGERRETVSRTYRVMAPSVLEDVRDLL